MSSDETAPAPTVQSLDDLFCPECGYSLRGLTSDRCPECGLGLAPLRAGVSQLPWIHRRQLGWFRAYWKTVWFVMFRSKQFRLEIGRPVRYADSQRFRWVTIAHACVALLLGVGLLALASPESIVDWYTEVGWIGSALLAVCWVLMLAAVTGVPSYFFGRRLLPIELQNRAIALSYYTTAVLAWLPLLVVVLAGIFVAFAGSFTASRYDREFATMGTAGCAVIGLIGIAVAWWFELLGLARRTLHGAGAVLLMALGAPLLWLLTAVAILVGIPCAVLFVALFVVSVF